jgi:endonuclease/exonuclease/phosphatase family metal-dependent hydrolase
MHIFAGKTEIRNLVYRAHSGMNRRDYLIENLRKYSTLAELQQSSFFAECRAEIESLLRNPEVCPFPAAAPRLSSFLRIVQWNIEKGKAYAAILENLRSDDILKWADIILLNEADYGMNRSGNRHVARCLSEALQMNLAFGPAHIELTKGVGDELKLEGENCESLQGNAILSRYPILEARVVSLPVCFEPFEFHEKRYGWRSCLWVRLQTGSHTLCVGSIHLEVRNTPRCRALQMEHLLQNLPGGNHAASVLGGDLNTNGFARGTRWRTLASLCRLAIRSSSMMKERFLHPEQGSEPLFRIVKKHGFFWEGLNSAEETACAPLGELEDASLLPRFLVRIVKNRLEPYGGELCFKLDWLVGREVHVLRVEELQDRETGVTSRDPGCVPLARCGSARPSDHRPIYADIRLPNS